MNAGKIFKIIEVSNVNWCCCCCYLCLRFCKCEKYLFFFFPLLNLLFHHILIDKCQWSKSSTYQQVCHIVERFVPHQIWNIEKCLNCPQKPVNLQLVNLGNLFDLKALKFSLFFFRFVSCSTSSSNWSAIANKKCNILI